MIKIHSQSGRVYEGEVYAVDPVTKSVVLKIDGAYTIINPAQINKIEGEITLKSPPLSDLGIRYVITCASFLFTFIS
jgi:hypothetical protein